MPILRSRRTAAVTVFSGKVDLGTGARAAIRQIVAEELGVSPARIALVEGDTALTPDQGSTGGSTGIPVGGMRIRQAAATARARLIALAAAHLQRPASQLDTRDGAIVINGESETIGFGALIGGGAFDVQVDKRGAAARSRHLQIVGTSYPRPDLPAKLTARHVYRAGPSHRRHVARARHPATRDRCAAARVDAASLEGIPQARVVRLRDFLAVVAPREWDAVRALRALQGDMERCRDTGRVRRAVRHRARDAGCPHARRCAASATRASHWRRHAQVIRASYAWPIQSHASMGPSCAVADIRDERRHGVDRVAGHASAALDDRAAARARRRQTASDLHGWLGQLRHERQ